MSLVPFDKKSVSVNRSRSSSLSSPVAKRFLYQEVFHNAENTLVRSFSCDQFSQKGRTGDTVSATRVRVASFMTPTKRFSRAFGRRSSLKSKKKDEQVLPQSERQHDSPPKRFFNVKSAALVGIATIIVGYWFISVATNCASRLDTRVIGEELRRSVLGQDAAISRILSALEEISTSKPAVLLFTGSVGVGKTLASSIIAQNLPVSVRPHAVFSETIKFTDPVEILRSHPCGRYLITIDDITPHTLLDVLLFSNLLLKESVLNGRYVILILIYQSVDVNEAKSVYNLLKDKLLDCVHVPFESLTSDAIKACFVSEMSKMNVTLDAAELERLIEGESEGSQVGGAPGCKRVRHKIVEFISNSR